MKGGMIQSKKRKTQDKIERGKNKMEENENPNVENKEKEPRIEETTKKEDTIIGELKIKTAQSVLEKYGLTNISENNKKMLKLYALFGMLSIEEQPKQDSLKFSFARLCDNQKLDSFWRIVLSQVFNIEKAYNRINWVLLCNQLETNRKQKCSRCLLDVEEECPFKILANLIYLEKTEGVSFEEMMELILNEKHEIVSVTQQLPMDFIDYIALKASEMLAKNDFVQITEETEEEIHFRYLDLETVQEQDFLNYLWEGEKKEGVLHKNHITADLHIDSEYFVQSPYHLAAYVLWFCQKEGIDLYSFYAKEEPNMKAQRDIYYYRNTQYIIKNMPYNEEVKNQLTNFLNFVQNNTKNGRKHLKIPLNIILYTTDNNIVQEVTSFLNGVIFYYGYVQNSKITSLSTNTIISDYRTIKRQYVRTTDQNTQEVTEPNRGMLLISDLGLLRHEKEDFRMRILNLLEESIKNSSYDIITVVTGKKETIQEILAENASLKHLFNICFEFRDLEETEVYDIVLKNVERLGKLQENFKDELKEYIMTTYMESDLKSKEYAFDLSNRITFNYLKKRNLAECITKEVLPAYEKKRKIEDILAELNDLTGLENIKEEINHLIDLLEFNKKLEKRGLADINLHMLFKGNPGTGKTTVARILADIFYQLGYINTNKLIEVEAKDLIGEYLGQTAPKTYRVVERALDGVLFIDEAYTLVNARGSADYASECISTLIKSMEDYKGRIIIIFAGYKEEMNNFVKLNPGILSRIGYDIEFKDYTQEQLLEIFEKTVEKRGLTLDEKAIEKVKQVLETAMKIENFGNARFMINLFEKSLLLHARNTKNLYNQKDLTCMTEKDIDSEIAENNLKNMTGRSGKIGFSID